MNGGEVDLRGTNYLVCKTPGTLVIDNKSLYAKLQRPYHGQSKKIDIELLALKEADHQNGLDLRWVSAQAQLANSLTKRGEDHQLNRFVACHQTWRTVKLPFLCVFRGTSSIGATEELREVGAMQFPLRAAYVKSM